jgi:uncharacterized protein (DUF362 family)
MMNRRNFIAATAGTILGTALNGDHADAGARLAPRRATVSLVKGAKRSTAIPHAIDMLSFNPVKGKNVLIKPNFNTADPFPAATHNDTLEQLFLHLRKMGAGKLTIGERSGPPDTAEVIRDMGISELCQKHDVGLINFEELPDKDWIRIKPKKSSWFRGFDVAKPVLDAECIVSTCCLKTHRFGGVFTMSLKLSVGITHKDNMNELHTSFFKQRKMIAEINQVYEPSLILMDGTEVFSDGGPMTGTKKRAEVMVASTDRIAIDAVGLAILKEVGANDDIMDKKIFEQEQISRAVELGLGVSQPTDIDIIADDAQSRQYAEKLTEILHKEST